MTGATLRSPETEIVERMGSLGLPQRDLAAAIGLEADKLSKVFNGRRRFQGDELDRARAWLKERESRKGALSPIPPDQLPTRPAEEGSTTLRQIDLGYSMGDGSNIDDYVEEGVFEIDTGLLRSITRTPPNRLFVARGDGDSMFPTLINDDMVLIDTNQRMLNLMDRVWAISLYGAGGIKRLRAVGPDKVEVISDNPNHANQVVAAEDLSIMGRVIWVARRL